MKFALQGLEEIKIIGGEVYWESLRSMIFRKRGGGSYG